MDIKILNPYKDSEAVWNGLDTPGLVRKNFKVITPENVGSKHIMSGLCVFAPGETSSVHNHPSSEEFNVVLSGSGEVVQDGEKRPFKKNDFIFIPEGVFHKHINNGDEPLVLLWCYSPQGQLPKD